MPRTGLEPTELKNRALDAAEREIVLRGAARLKLTDVARSLGVSHAALYNHFQDREALLDAVSQRWLDRIDGELESIAQGPEPVEERLASWFLTLHRRKRERILANPELYEAFDLAARKQRPFVQRHLTATRRQLEAMAADGVASGSFRGNPSEIAAQLFTATVAFHHPGMVAQSGGRDRSEELKSLLAVLIQGLGAGQAS